LCPYILCFIYIYIYIYIYIHAWVFYSHYLHNIFNDIYTASEYIS
jgi:hypothetical protein